MANELPLSIRDVGPDDGAIRLTGTRPDGLPDGFHTGGAWLLGNEVYKPLDGRPYANCEFHYPTREAEVLELMAGQTLFPRNWRIEERNGRRFLVRKKAMLIPDEIPYDYLKTEQVLLVEQGIRNLNRNHWEINDTISLAMDSDTYELFILDMSAAQEMNGQGCYAADDEWRIREFFKLCKAERILKLREHASHILTAALWGMKHPNHRHVYASFNRPISGIWASLPKDTEYIHQERANWEEMIPWTWIITTAPLPDEKIKSYELVWGWSPVHDKE